MKKTLFYRCHEWLADHVKWVQYPNVRSTRPLFRYQMPWTMRVWLMLVGFTGLLVSLILIAPLLLLAWAFFN